MRPNDWRLILAIAMSSLVAMVGNAFAGHCHYCKKCCVTCCPQCGSQDQAPPPSQQRQPVAARTAPVAQAQIVQSMPIYSMPMMFATMPVMPTMAASPAPAAAQQNAPRDCCDRVDSLEKEMKKLAESVNDMQTLIKGQTEILKILAEDRQRGYKSAPPKPPMASE